MLLEFHVQDKIDVHIEYFCILYDYVVDMYNIDMLMYTIDHIHNRFDNLYYHKIDIYGGCYILDNNYLVNEQFFHSKLINKRN